MVDIRHQVPGQNIRSYFEETAIPARHHTKEPTRCRCAERHKKKVDTVVKGPKALMEFEKSCIDDLSPTGG